MKYIFPKYLQRELLVGGENSDKWTLLKGGKSTKQQTDSHFIENNYWTPTNQRQAAGLQLNKRRQGQESIYVEGRTTNFGK